ncbi:MAG: NAD(P)-dependent alcohol dehydrogenase [Fimbriimonas sp.]|nr:NAD(P)-dependent alcohol dehydrogenase [Fimbriimonas sp.]
MRAFRLYGFGLDGLAIGDLATPDPGPGQVLVETRAVSLNYRDLLMVKGLYNKHQPLPMTPASDGAGEVVAVGKDVSGLKKGDRVIGAFMQGWLDGPYTRDKSRTSLGGELPGTLATHFVLEAAGAIKIPDYLSYEEAAALPCAAVTAWNALFCESKLNSGQTLLVQGTGGASVCALQLAHAAGANVVVTSSSDDKLLRTEQLGAWKAINYRSTPHWGAAARELTGGGVDLVLEVGGVGTLRQSLDAVKYGGHIVLIGNLAVATGELPANLIIHKGVHIRGLYVGSIRMLKDVVAYMSSHSIRPVVGASFEFEQTIDALKLMESGGHFGKIVIRF